MKAFCMLIVLIVVVNALLVALFVGRIILPDCAGWSLAITCCSMGFRLYVWMGMALGTNLWHYSEGEKYKDCMDWGVVVPMMVGVVVNPDWLTALSNGGGVGNPFFMFLMGSMMLFLFMMLIWYFSYFFFMSFLISCLLMSCFSMVMILYKWMGIMFLAMLGVYLMALST